jgi:RNA polymerase sigma-70 factor (ECF subfamily)
LKNKRDGFFGPRANAVIETAVSRVLAAAIADFARRRFSLRRSKIGSRQPGIGAKGAAGFYFPVSPQSSVPDSTASITADAVTLGIARAEQTRWFAEEVYPHEPQLRAFLHRQFPTLRDTDDLVQESYLKIIRARRAGRIKSVKSYLFGIARNAALSLFRRKRVTHEISVGDFDAFSVMEDDVNVVTSVSVRQELALVVEAIDRLPDRCREVVILWALEGLSREEVAARLGISEHTVRAQLAKGMKRCVVFMRERGILDEMR